MTREYDVLPAAEEEVVTRRTIALAIIAAICALPLIWFSVDADAGDTLLKLTKSAPNIKTAQR